MNIASILGIATAAVCATFAGTASAASYFDGSTTLLCTAQRFHQCDAEDGCVKVKAQEIGVARGQWLVDFKNKVVRPADPKINRQSKITTVQYVEGTLYAQAIELDKEQNPDGIAWSLSISDPDGAMTLAAASKDAAFVGTGICVPAR
jgi:hypothetical protein